MSLTSNQKAVGCSHSSDAAVTPIDTSCETGCYFSLQSPLLHMTTDDVSSLITCMAPSYSMKASQEEGNSNEFELDLSKSYDQSIEYLQQ